MKKSLLLVALLFVGSMAMAQNTDSNADQQKRQMPNAEEMVNRQTERMVKELSLNDSQKAQLLKLNKEYMGKIGRGMRGPRQQNADNNSQAPTKEQMEKMRTERKASMDAYNTELKKILTDEQYTLYQKKQQERMQQMKQRRQDRQTEKQEGASDQN